MSSTNSGGMATRLALEKLPDYLGSDPPEEALARISSELHQLGLRSRSMFQMGAAVLIATLLPDRLKLTHAGDCRAYGARGRLTRDHVYLDLPGQRVLVRHLGLKQLEPEVTILNQDGRLLLCSDGLHHELEEDEIVELLATGTEEEACRALVEAALRRGGRDNVTVLVVGTPLL